MTDDLSGAVERLKGVFENKYAPDTRSLTALEDDATFGDLRTALALIAAQEEELGRLKGALKEIVEDHNPTSEIHPIAWWIDLVWSFKAIASAALSPQARQAESFQAEVWRWALECFGETIPRDVKERCDRFVEEALELVQSLGYDRRRVASLTDYVFDREPGEPHQEVGGVKVTLAALCAAVGLDMDADGRRELDRIWTKVEAIRAKQAAKPTGSALPVAQPARQAEGREGWFRQALEDVCNPLAKIRRDAEAKGHRLSGQAYEIAHSLSFVQGIAREALACALTPPVEPRPVVDDE
jgi:hypothetical protein